MSTADLDLLKQAQEAACGCTDDQDWCRICGRATCHWGEHSDAQLLEFIGRA